MFTCVNAAACPGIPAQQEKLEIKSRKIVHNEAVVVDEDVPKHLTVTTVGISACMNSERSTYSWANLLSFRFCKDEVSC